MEDNVSVDSIDFSQRALGVGQSLQLRAHLHNRGPRAYPAARVLLRVDGKPESTSQIALEPGTAAQVLFACQFKTAGSHVVEVEAAVDDRLATDNRCAASIPVLERIDVLLVDGAPSSIPLEGETDFLAVALTPYTLGAPNSRFAGNTYDHREELDERALAGARVVVLANVARLTDEQVGVLADYVRGGGSLLVFLGNKIDMPWYNQTLHSGTSPLLPMPLLSLEGNARDNPQSARVVAQYFEHPALELFNDRANGNLADVEIRNWYRFGRPEKLSPAGQNSDDRPDGALVLARLETGDPLIVQRHFGAGVVVQVATACDADWSRSPCSPYTSARPAVGHDHGLPGDAFSQPPDGERWWPSAGDARAFPSRSHRPTAFAIRAPVARGTSSVVQFDRTAQPGVYTLTGSEGETNPFRRSSPTN